MPTGAVTLLPMTMLRHAVLLAFCCTLAAQTVRTEVLSNGLTLVVQRQSLSHALELRLVVRAGPLHEGGLLGSGVSELVRSLRAEGVRTPAGGPLRSSTATDHTAYALTVVDDQLDAGLAVLASIAARQTVDPAAFAQAVAEQSARLARYAKDPAQLEERLLRTTVYQRHPARLPIGGIPEQLETLTMEQVQAYGDARYTANNLILIAVGNIDREAWLRQQVEQHFGSLRSGSWQLERAEDEPPQQAERAVVRGGVDRQRDVIAWRTLPLDRGTQLLSDKNPDGRSQSVHAVLDVVAELLADRRFSPLHQALGKPLLAEQVRVVHQAPSSLSGLFAISYAPVPEQAPQALEATLSVLAKLAAEGPSADALAAAKATLRRRNLQAGVANQAETLAHSQLATGDAAWSERCPVWIDAVSSDDVRTVVSTWLAPQGRNRTRIVLDPQAQAVVERPGPAVAKTDAAPESTDLVAGAKLLTKRIDGCGLAHLGVVVAGGAADEPAGLPGLSSLVATLLAEGSSQRHGADLSRWLGQRGMELRCAASTHGIELHITCFPADLGDAADMLVAILKDPAVPAESVASAVEAWQARLGLPAEHANWRARLLGAVRGTQLAGHYGAGMAHSVDRERLGGLGRDETLAWWRTQAVGHRLCFALWGEITTAEAVADRLRQGLAGAPGLNHGEPWMPTGTSRPEGMAPRVSQSWGQEQVALALSWPGPPLERLDQDGAANELLAHLVRDRRPGTGLAKGLAAVAGATVLELDVTTEAYAGRGLWTVLVLFDGAEARKEVEAAIRAGVAGLAQRLQPAEGEATVADAEVEVARLRARAQRSLAAEDLARASLDHAQASLLGRLPQHHAARTRIQEVIRTDLLRVAGTYLGADPAVVELLPANATPPVAPPQPPAIIPAPLVVPPAVTPTAEPPPDPPTQEPLQP